MTIVDKLKAVLDLAEKATRGPWNAKWAGVKHSTLNWVIAGERRVLADGGRLLVSDAEFVANARTTSPAMARALLVLWPALESIERCGGLTLEEKNAATLRLLAAFEQAKKELE